MTPKPCLLVSPCSTSLYVIHGLRRHPDSGVLGCPHGSRTACSFGHTGVSDSSSMHDKAPTPSVSADSSTSHRSTGFLYSYGFSMITLDAYEYSLSLSSSTAPIIYDESNTDSSGSHSSHSPDAIPQDQDCDKFVGQEESGDSDGDRDDADIRDGRRKLKRRPLRIRVRSVRTRHR